MSVSSRQEHPRAATPGAVQSPQLCEHTVCPWQGWHWASEARGGSLAAPCSSCSPGPRLELCTGPVPWCRALHSWNSRAQPLQQTNAQVYSLAKALPVLDPREKFRNCSANTHGRCGNLVTGLYLQKKAVA